MLSHIEREFFKVSYDVLNDGLQIRPNKDIVLKEEKGSIIGSSCPEKRIVYCLVVLLADFRKSLVYQHLPFVLDELVPFIKREWGRLITEKPIKG